MSHRTRPFWASAGALGVIAMTGLLAGSGPAEPSAAPKYNAKGELERPEGYRAWVFVGADLGLEYKNELAENTPRERKRHEGTDVGVFHNIYIDRAAYESYVKTRKFPDKTVLVMELFQAKQKEPRGIVTEGHYEAERVGLEVAVKDSRRPKNGGGGDVPWAYYVFGNPPKAATLAQPKDQCYDCHLKNADVDNVWVQFYPTLRDLNHP